MSKNHFVLRAVLRAVLRDVLRTVNRTFFKNLQLTCLFAGLLISSTALAQEEIPDSDDNFQSRLDNLKSALEEARVENNIPGFAIAVVKDGEFVMAEGFGHADLEKQVPVTPETMFAIGSSTKAFTGALIGMLVDEDKIDWDDDVTKYLPEFKLDVDTGDKSITILDLLSHRTGFTRMGLIWATGNLTREEVLQQATQAKPYGGFREQWLYNNVMYLAAGMAAGKAADSDWNTLIEQRIFQPLGMNDSTTTIEAARQEPRFSKGYVWHEDREIHEAVPMRSLNSIGPAGSINSNATDMAQWLKFQLAEGKFDNQQLLSQKSLKKTWRKHSTIGGSMGYGCGWMLQTWNGHKVIQHGGNIDGFAAQVTLLPKKNCGYVLLANVTVTPLQAGSINTVFDTLFGEKDKAASDPLAEINTDELIGKYVGYFANFRGTVFEVQMKDEKLAIDIPGQMLFELKPPNEEGKWYFELTDTIAISFNRDESDGVRSLTMYQGGFEPEMFREDVTLEPIRPLEELQTMVGTYRDEQMGEDDPIEVAIVNGRLLFTSGAARTFYGAVTDEPDTFAYQPKPELFQFRFNKSDDGKVESLSWIHNGDEAIFDKSESDATQTTLPTTDELMAKMAAAYGIPGDEDQGYEDKVYKLTGESNYVHQGINGETTLWFDLAGRYMLDHDFGKICFIKLAFDGTAAVTYSDATNYSEMEGEQLAQSRQLHPLWFLANWKQDYQSATLTGIGEHDGEATYEVTFQSESLEDRIIHVDQKTFQVVKEILELKTEAGAITTVTTYSEFKDVDGFNMPMKIKTDNPLVGLVTMEFSTGATVDKIPQGTFTIENPEEQTSGDSTKKRD